MKSLYVFKDNILRYAYIIMCSSCHYEIWGQTTQAGGGTVE